MKYLQLLFLTLFVYSCSTDQDFSNQEAFEVEERHNQWNDAPEIDFSDDCMIDIYVSEECIEKFVDGVNGTIEEFNALENVGINMGTTSDIVEADIIINCESFNDLICLRGFTPAGEPETTASITVWSGWDCQCGDGDLAIPNACQYEWLIAHEVMHVLGFWHITDDPDELAEHPHIDGTLVSDPTSVTTSASFVADHEGQTGFCDCDELPLFSEGDIEALEIMYPLTDDCAKCFCDCLEEDHTGDYGTPPLSFDIDCDDDRPCEEIAGDNGDLVFDCKKKKQK